MRKVLILVTLVLLFAAIAFAVWWLLERRGHEVEPSIPPTSQTTAPVSQQHVANQIPKPHQGPVRFRPVLRTRELQFLDSPYFSIGYDNQRKNPAWVSYDLDGPITHPGQEPTRPATFATDFRTSAHVAHRDYSGSGFDRGHMCPAYAMYSRHGREGFLATFTCSNIIPQPHQVNAGIWEELEVQIAGRAGRGGGWAERLGRVTVINGPVYDRDPGHLRTGVTIPSACFSIVLRLQPAGYEAIAFEIPNVEGTRGPLTRWITTIKKIEDDTGLDVFAGEAKGERAKLEMVRSDRVW